jgi:hypothetical protein
MRDQQEDTEYGQSTDQDDRDRMTIETGWAKPPTIEELKADFAEAQASHTAHEAQVRKWLDALNGRQHIISKPGRSRIVPKVIRKNAEWRYASLSEPFLSTEDLFETAPRTFEDKKSAIQDALVLNYQFNQQIDKVAFIDEYTRTSVDEGTVIVKVGWENEEEEQEVEVPVMGMVPVQDPQQAQEMLMAGQLPMQEQQVDVRLEMQVVVTKNQPTLEICDYRNVLVDPTCHGEVSKANFIIYSFDTSKSDLKKDGRYQNVDQIHADNSSVLADPDFDSQDDTHFSFKDDARKKVVAYEYWGYWDIDNSGMTTSIVSTWVGDTLIRMEKSPFPFKELPFVLVQHLPVRKKNFGQPDGFLIEDNQKVIGAVTRGVIDIIGRAANGQMGTRKDALDLVNARKFERGDDFKFNSNIIDTKQAFQMQTYPEIPKSAFEMLNLMSSDAESLTGVKAFSQGLQSQSLGDSVGGIKSAMDATAKRELNILRRLANGIIKIGRMFIAMNGEFLEDEEVIRITNEEFVAISREDLGGEHDVRLNISTPEADNEKAQELAFMLQTTGNSMDPGLANMILADIARLRKMPELAKRIEEYKPEPDPIAEEMKILERDKLKAEVENEQAKARENTIDVDLKAAKADSERAKARKLNSDADKADLDFVEQESGVTRKHESDMKEMDHMSTMDQKAFDAMHAEKAPATSSATSPTKSESTKSAKKPASKPAGKKKVTDKQK